ncbi:MAG: hypothetical protein ABGW69_00385, partial [Nanoarchaeota archaeon]
MFETKKLKLITIAVPIEKKEELINLLGEMGLIHLKEIGELDNFSNLKLKNEEIEEIEKNNLNFSSVLSWIIKSNIELKEPLENELKKIKPYYDKELIEKAKQIVNELLKLIREYEELKNNKLLEIKRKIKYLEILNKLNVENLDELKIKTAKIYIFLVDKDKFKHLNSYLEKEKDKIIEKRTEKLNDNEQIIFILAKEEINAPFNNLKNEIINALEEELKNKKVQNLLIELKNELDTINRKINELKSEIVEKWKNYKSIILPIYKYFKINAEKIEKAEKLKETKNLFIVQGYIEEEKIGCLKKELEKKIKDYLIEIQDVKEAP